MFVMFVLFINFVLLNFKKLWKVYLVRINKH